MRATMHRRHALAVAAATLALAAAGTASAQAPAYPAKAITFIVPFAAGSATDQLARALGQSVTTDTKQPVVVDNKAGASGMIAAQAAAKAPADGYTVLITTNTTHAANEHLYKKLSYDPVKDFAPISGLGKGGQVLVVNPASPHPLPRRPFQPSPSPLWCRLPQAAPPTSSRGLWASPSPTTPSRPWWSTTRPVPAA